MSNEDLIAHLGKLSQPDQVYWDSRELKKTGQKFQSLAWSHWPRAEKSQGNWVLVRPQADASLCASAVAHRIQQTGLGAPFIALGEREYHAYQGSGQMLARFVGGELQELWHPFGMINGEDFSQSLLQLQTYIHDWLQKAEGEIWFVMCSCHELINPKRVSLSDTASTNTVHREFSAVLYDAHQAIAA